MVADALRYQPRLTPLNPEQIDAIHAATLTLLAQTGVKVTHPQALDIFNDLGARVDGDRVRIPSPLVEEALARISRDIVLANRGGEPGVRLAQEVSWFGANLDGINYLDPLNQQRRPFTVEDNRVAITIADALPHYTWGMTFGLIEHDAPQLADRIVAKQALLYSTKPLVFCCKDINSLKDIHQMAVVIAGSSQQFRQAPCVAAFISPISPLVHSDDAIQKMIYCAENGIPQICYPGLQAGSTAPMSFAASIVQASAETLSGLVLVQAVRPGAPFVCGAFTTVMDMRSTIFSYGAPEMSLMVAVLAQMAQHYRLPFMGTAGCTDAKLPDGQAAAEASVSCFSSVISGANMVHDCGLLEHGSTVSPAFAVLVDEIIAMVQPYAKGMALTPEAFALDLIDKIGPGGHFLEETHTFQHYRDVWYSNLFERNLYHKWVGGGAKDLQVRLRERTQAMMEPQPSTLPPEMLAELERMEKDWE